MFGTSEKRNMLFFFFPILFIKIFTISIEHLFPFNWSLWFFFVGMAFVGLGESLESEVLDFKVLSKKEYFRRESVDHFCDKAG